MFSRIFRPIVLLALLIVPAQVGLAWQETAKPNPTIYLVGEHHDEINHQRVKLLLLYRALAGEISLFHEGIGDSLAERRFLVESILEGLPEDTNLDNLRGLEDLQIYFLSNLLENNLIALPLYVNVDGYSSELLKVIEETSDAFQRNTAGWPIWLLALENLPQREGELPDDQQFREEIFQVADVLKIFFTGEGSFPSSTIAHHPMAFLVVAHFLVDTYVENFLIKRYPEWINRGFPPLEDGASAFLMESVFSNGRFGFNSIEANETNIENLEVLKLHWRDKIFAERLLDLANESKKNDLVLPIWAPMGAGHLAGTRLALETAGVEVKTFDLSDSQTLVGFLQEIENTNLNTPAFERAMQNYQRIENLTNTLGRMQELNASMAQIAKKATEIIAEVASLTEQLRKAVASGKPEEAEKFRQQIKSLNVEKENLDLALNNALAELGQIAEKITAGVGDLQEQSAASSDEITTTSEKSPRDLLDEDRSKWRSLLLLQSAVPSDD